MKRIAVIAAIAASIFVTGSRTLSQAPPPGGPNQAGAPVGPSAGAPGGADPFTMLLQDEKLRRELGVTPQQLDKITAIAMDSIKKSIRAGADLAVLQVEMQELMDADNPDIAKIEAKIDEISKVQTAEQKRVVRAELNMRGVLTKEQWEKLRQKIGRVQPPPPPGGPKGAPGGPIVPQSD